MIKKRSYMEAKNFTKPNLEETKMNTKTKEDTVFRKTDRYNQYKIETKDVWQLFNMNPWTASAFKYLDRHEFKDSEESDLNKALYYLTEACSKVENSYTSEGIMGMCSIWKDPDFVNLETYEYILEKTGAVAEDVAGTDFIEVIDTKVIDLIIEDRGDKGNRYILVMLLLLEGQYHRALTMLKLTMKINGVTIHEQ